MATTVAEPVFVDTNVLVYSTAALSPFHSVAVAKLQELVTAGHALWVSRQILREYLSALSRPGLVGAQVSMAALLADVHLFESRFFVADEGPEVTGHLLALLGTIACTGKQVHDANVVATMLAYGIPKLLTHNVADFHRFTSHIAVMPLVV
jgi:predicted nucleic acid-binding protein